MELTQEYLDIKLTMRVCPLIVQEFGGCIPGVASEVVIHSLLIFILAMSLLF